MANIPAPGLEWQYNAALLAQTDIAPGGEPTYTGRVLSYPAANQLLPPPPTPSSGLFVWQRSVVDGSGNVLTDARVEVRNSEGLAVASIYADREGDTAKSNPFLVDSEGFARFYAPAGLYTITVSRSGLTRIYENVLLGIRLVDLPDISHLVAPIAEEIIADALAEFVIPDGYVVVGVGAINADGSAAQLPAGWTSSYAGGVYTVNHGQNLEPGSYAVLLSPTQGGGHANPQPSEYLQSEFRYRVFNDENGLLGNTPVRFALIVMEKFGT